MRVSEKGVVPKKWKVRMKEEGVAVPASKLLLLLWLWNAHNISLVTNKGSQGNQYILSLEHCTEHQRINKQRGRVVVATGLLQKNQCLGSGSLILSNCLQTSRLQKHPIQSAAMHTHTHKHTHTHTATSLLFVWWLNQTAQMQLYMFSSLSFFLFVSLANMVNK